MRNHLRLVLALGSASVFGAALLLACSDDTSVAPVTEAGSDAPSKSDSPIGPDGGGGPDTSPPFDGGFVVDTFDSVVATELCGTLARCCYGSAMPGPGAADGGTFDTNACIAAFGSMGFLNSNVGTAQLRDGGSVALDQVSADSCIKKIKAMSCNLPGPDYVAARAACFGAYSGKIAASGACTATVECQAGLFCKGQKDGGTGVCTAIKALNGGCGENPDHPTEYEEECSYRGGGDNGVFCKNYDFGTDSYLDAGAWTCTAAGGVGSRCANHTWCKDTICQPSTAVCETPEKIFDTSCGLFVK